MDKIFLYFRYADLLLRIKELESWTSDFSLPSSVWLSGFFNPQSFLTAIMQSTARKNELPLDKMSLTCEVSKKYPGESMQVPRDGAYVHGLFIEGARWVFLLNSSAYLCYFSKKNGDKNVGLNHTGRLSFLTGQGWTPKFAEQVLPDQTESRLTNLVSKVINWDLLENK